MTGKERIEIKQLIIERIKELREEVEQMEADLKPVAPDNAYGRLSRMEAISSKAISDSAMRDKSMTLRRLLYALSISDNEGYGICSKCGEGISYARLTAVPYAALCIKCAQRS